MLWRLALRGPDSQRDQRGEVRKALLPDPSDLEEFFDRLKAAPLVPFGEDGGSDRRPHARKTFEIRLSGLIDRHWTSAVCCGATSGTTDRSGRDHHG
jgi:hypothetical protein